MSRFRIQSPLSVTHFEQRSVQLIAACALGLAGIVSVQVSPPTRQAMAAFTPSRHADAPRPAQLAHHTIVKTSQRR